MIERNEIKEWLPVKLNPKILVCGSIYRCPNCQHDLYVPYGRSISKYTSCPACSIELRSSEV